MTCHALSISDNVFGQITTDTTAVHVNMISLKNLTVNLLGNFHYSVTKSTKLTKLGQVRMIYLKLIIQLKFDFI